MQMRLDGQEPEVTRIIIAGSRNMTDYGLMKKTWADYLKRHGLEANEIHIISGGAPGADSLAERLAKEERIAITVFKADWKKHGRAAGPIRNRAMAENADALLAFLQENSKGTANMVQQAKKHGLDVTIINI